MPSLGLKFTGQAFFKVADVIGRKVVLWLRLLLANRLQSRTGSSVSILPLESVSFLAVLLCVGGQAFGPLCGESLCVQEINNLPEETCQTD